MSKRKSNQDQEYEEEYRKKRERNNQAVKRSRVKSKQKTKETQTRVDEIKVRNQVLEEKIQHLTKNLKFLKELFIAQAQTKSDKISNLDIKKLLEDNDSEDEAGSSKT